MIENKRKDPEAKPWGFVVCNDRFMSGWGKAPSRSYYALAVESPEEAEIVAANGRGRSEMTHVRIVSPVKYQGQWMPRVARNLCKGDHLSIVDQVAAAPWYVERQWVEA